MEFKTEGNAVDKALELYKEHYLDTVAVVKVTIGETPDIVFLQERICKHKNIQSEFSVMSLGIVSKCVECRDIIPKEKELLLISQDKT